MAFIQSWSLFKRCVYSNLLYIQIDWPFIQIGRLSKFVIYSMWLFIPICCLFELVGYVNWMVVYSNWSLIQICCLFKFGVYSNLWCTRFGCLFKFGVYSNLVLIQLRCFSKLSFIQILLFIFKLLHIQICPYIQIGSCSPIAVPVHRSHDNFWFGWVGDLWWIEARKCWFGCLGAPISGRRCWFEWVGDKRSMQGRRCSFGWSKVCRCESTNQWKGRHLCGSLHSRSWWLGLHRWVAPQDQHFAINLAGRMVRARQEMVTGNCIGMGVHASWAGVRTACYSAHFGVRSNSMVGCKSMFWRECISLHLQCWVA